MLANEEIDFPLGNGHWVGAMFGKLVEGLEKTAVRNALKKGRLGCPECGSMPGKSAKEMGRRVGVCGMWNEGIAIRVAIGKGWRSGDGGWISHAPAGVEDSARKCAGRSGGLACSSEREIRISDVFRGVLASDHRVGEWRISAGVSGRKGNRG